MKRKIEIIGDVTHIECSKCHVLLPATYDYYVVSKGGKLGLKSWCKMCEKARREGIKDEIKVYYQENAEHFREYSKKYREENPIKYSETKENSYNKHREKNIERDRIRHLNNKDKEKQYREENKEKIYNRYRKYVSNNPEKRKQTIRNHRENNRDKYIAYQQKRRALKNGLISTLTIEDWNDCLKFFDNKDAYTGLEMNLPTKDHVIPVSKGGSYVKTNIIPCNTNINSSKGNRDLEEWYKKQSFFDENRLKKIYRWIGYNEKFNIQQLSIL